MQMLNQSKKAPYWLGMLQVQLTNSFFYTTLYSVAALSLTFWYTAGDKIAAKYVPWMDLRIFLGICLLGLIVLMVVDYRFIYPVRQRFINEQACKHENPAMELLRKLDDDIAKIKTQLGVTD